MLPRMRDGSKCHQFLKGNKYSLYYGIQYLLNEHVLNKTSTRTRNVCKSLSMRVGYKRGWQDWKFFAICINIAENSSSHNFSKFTAYIQGWLRVVQIGGARYKLIKLY